jgi:hypothetical protein
LGLDRRQAFYWSRIGEEYREWSIRSEEDRVVEQKGHVPHPLDPDPFSTFRTAEALGLQPGEEILSARITFEAAASIKDPVLVELEELRKSAAEFCDTQPPLVVTLDEEELRRFLCEAFEREMSDVRALAESLFADDVVSVPPTTRYILVALDSPSSRFVPGARGTVQWAELGAPGDADECHVALVQGVERSGIYAPPRELADEFGLPEDSVRGGGYGVARASIALLSGYRDKDIDLRWPAPEVLSRSAL